MFMYKKKNYPRHVYVQKAWNCSDCTMKFPEHILNLQYQICLLKRQFNCLQIVNVMQTEAHQQTGYIQTLN